MSQATPSKEPSMDEILASIRRIIESGEERPKPALSATTLRQGASEIRGSASFHASRRPEAPAAPRQPAVAKVVSFAERAEPAPLPASAEVADIGGDTALGGARAGAHASAFDGTHAEPDENVWNVEAMDLIDEALSSEIPAPGMPDVTHPADEASIESHDRIGSPTFANSADIGSDTFAIELDEEDFAEDLRRNAGLVEAASTADLHWPAPSNDVEPHAEPETSDVESPAAEPWRAEPARVPQAVAAGATSVVAETSAIMSDEAGAQVAAAFDDLASAIREGQMKSMETMAREMLRPMLQDWLDDNLPRLVERLVREEIERVARGGRR